MRVSSFNFSDISGGAARAAYRIHCAVRGAGIDSVMQVAKSTSGDWTVSQPPGKVFKFGRLARPQFVSLAHRLLRGDQHEMSSAILNSKWPARINQSSIDVVHLHWVNHEMMSVKDIAQIHKPIVWTLHDMWAFCGAEHYSNENRWADGYLSANRPTGEGGFDLSKWVWKRKRDAWRKPMQIVTPSRWLADCVKESALMEEWPVTTIPNAIDTDVWRPIERVFARHLMGLPLESKLIGFGALGGGEQPRKGFDLLMEALAHLRGQVSGLELVVFGQHRPRNLPDYGFPIHFTGHLHDDLSLRALYSSADVMIIPSRMDNLPNVGIEAMACGTPVVAFDICGLPDIVTHKHSGWLAKAFDTEDMARGIQWVLADTMRHDQLCKASRHDAVARYSYPVVAAQYGAIYRRALQG